MNVINVSIKDKNEEYIILGLYVDDIIIVNSKDKVIQSIKDMLTLNFDIKDMGLEDVILGVKITRISDILVFSQTRYIDKIL